MFERARCFSYLWWVVVLVSCGLPPEKRGEAPPEQTAVTTPSPTPQPIQEIPTPTIMQATIYGRVLWPDGGGAAGITVIFCEDFTLYGACGDKSYEVMTDDEGWYIFTHVEPGEYTLVVEIEGEQETSPYQYASDLGMKVKTFMVERQQMLEIAPLRLVLRNLEAIGPQGTLMLPVSESGEGLTHEIELRWLGPEETAVYEVYLAPEKGEAMFVNEQVEIERLTAVLPRLNCAYHWQVVAFDAEHIKIAQTQMITFTVTGAAVGCDVTLLPPRIGEATSEMIKPLILDWEAHALADTYQVWLVDAENPHRPPILDFAEVSRSSFELNNRLRASRYFWTVIAFAKNGRLIAESEIAKFEIDELGGIGNSSIQEVDDAP